MPNKYKLTYFNAKGRGECARLMFAQAGVAYDDVRVEQKDWPELKKKMPQGTMPTLEQDGGKLVLSQSGCINRHLARELKLYGKSNQDAAITDLIYDTLVDLVSKAIDAIFEKDEERKKTLQEKFKGEQMPFFLGVLNDIVSKNGKDGYAVGSSVTLADLALFSNLEMVNCVEAVEAEKDKYGALLKNREKIRELPKIKAWLAKRPATSF